MASPQPENGYTRVANELYEQLMSRGFTKRQRVIIDLIVRLSYGCGKKTAHIPMLKFFAIVGVTKTNIAAELKSMIDKRVIGCDGDTNEYWLNKNYDEWCVPSQSGNVALMFTELLRVNLSGSQNNNSVSDGSSQNKNLQQAQSSQNNNHMVIETRTNELLKQEPRQPENPRDSRAREVSKESIKERLKKEIIIMDSAPVLNEDQQQALKLLYQLVTPAETDAGWIRQIASQYPNVHLAETALALVTWLNGKPKERDKAKANHRSRFLNFVKREAKNPHSQTSNPSRKSEGDFDFNEAGRLREQIEHEQQRRGTKAVIDTHRATGSRRGFAN